MTQQEFACSFNFIYLRRIMRDSIRMLFRRQESAISGHPSQD